MHYNVATINGEFRDSELMEEAEKLQGDRRNDLARLKFF